MGPLGAEYIVTYGKANQQTGYVNTVDGGELLQQLV